MHPQNWYIWEVNTCCKYSKGFINSSKLYFRFIFGLLCYNYAIYIEYYIWTFVNIILKRKLKQRKLVSCMNMTTYFSKSSKVICLERSRLELCTDLNVIIVGWTLIFSLHINFWVYLSSTFFQLIFSHSVSTFVDVVWDLFN